MEEKIDRTDETTIDLSRLLRELVPVARRLFYLPLILAVLVGALWLGKTYLTYTPMYRCEVTFTIQVSSSGSGTGYNYYNKTVAEQLGKTFPYLINSDYMYSRLKKELGVGYINGSISAETVENTNLFTMRVVSNSASDAMAILQAAINVYPEVADYVIGSTSMNLLTEPTEPTAPYNGINAASELIKGVLMGFAAGVAVLLVCAMLRNTVRESEDIRNKLNQSCLATLPRVTFKKRTNGMADNSVTILNPRVPSAFQESIRGLRLKLLRKMEGEGCRAILVTSTMPGEGKTTVSTNLALALSKNGAQVILIDMDLRRPSVKKALGVTTPSNGLVELRERKVASLGACLNRIEGTTLTLLAGDIPRKSTRPISARWMKNLIDTLRSQADYIIVDTPPTGLLADSANIANAVDCAVYVIGAGGVETPQILDGLQTLSESGVGVIGCVLNGVQTSYGSYGSKYGYGYSNGYYGAKNKSQDEK